MKIYIERFSQGSSDGKSKFCNRLGTELESRGHTITGDSSIFVDVGLSLAGRICKNAKHSISRLDGIYFDTKTNYRTKNAKIREAIESANAVVYQSEFSRKLCEAFLGDFDPHRVIYNGAPIVKREVKKRKDFITVARWRRFKRLEETIEAFLRADIDGVLYVVGKDGKDTARVKYLGYCDADVMNEFLDKCVASIHLSWFDACPNGVVESICRGVPVICGNSGGTHEIVKESNGYVCDIDDEFDFKPKDIYNPPAIDLDLVVEVIRVAYYDQRSTNSNYVNIKNIASQYMEFFDDINSNNFV